MPTGFQHPLGLAARQRLVLLRLAVDGGARQADDIHQAFLRHVHRRRQLADAARRHAAPDFRDLVARVGTVAACKQICRGCRRDIVKRQGVPNRVLVCFGYAGTGFLRWSRSHG
jgi:hypothetical protein